MENGFKNYKIVAGILIFFHLWNLRCKTVTEPIKIQMVGGQEKIAHDALIFSDENYKHYKIPG